ncbi:MAG: helicase C-terminal domain-containing protein [Bacillota bacterium]
MAKKVVKVGVKDLLETLFHPKDLGTAFIPATRGQEGIEGHHLLTSQRPAGYQTEVPVEFIYDWADYRLIVQGRIDGLLESEGALVAEEIKTTYLPLEALAADRFPVHQAQLQLYLYFLMAKNPGKRISGRLTYFSLNDLSERTFPLEISFDEACEFFNTLAETYLAICRNRDNWLDLRNGSITNLPFPFPESRPGQEELMDLVTQAIEQERDLLVEAATGIGKTVAVLYPALKQLPQNKRINQIFFLTAKTAGKEILKKTLSTARQQGLRLRTVFIEAKERVCLSPGAQCHPLYCPYALDYYPKAARVTPMLLDQELITPETLLECAKLETICPFELSLDLAFQADLIVCDYNYVFDPGVYLRRFFLNSGRRDYLFLVDEAHNMVARGREMYSATLALRDLVSFQNEIAAVDKKAAAGCGAVAEFFQVWDHEIAEERRPGIRLSHLPDLFEPALERLAATLDLLLRERLPAELRRRVRDFYFNLSAFTRIAALTDKDFAIYVKQESEGAVLRLFCFNPGRLLRRRIEQGRLAIFFSATLSPLNYFRELLGCGPDSLSLQIPSPFPQETRLYLQVPGIDTRFRSREASAPALAGCIADLVTAHTGNYLIFFPSYTYMKAVWPYIKQAVAGKAGIFAQAPSMKEAQKQEFLRRITSVGTGYSQVGLAVLGGLFGEGVDLPGEQLIGVMIIGPGLPVVNDEQELLRMYFDERNGEGFLYAYLIPGLIRVIQSAGRVFRTPEDKGVVLLVDDRFLDQRYQELLPPDWFMPGRPFSNPDYRRALAEFWGECPGGSNVGKEFRSRQPSK